jgi:hypothetical protein
MDSIKNSYKAVKNASKIITKKDKKIFDRYLELKKELETKAFSDKISPFSPL